MLLTAILIILIVAALGLLFFVKNEQRDLARLIATPSRRSMARCLSSPAWVASDCPDWQGSSASSRS